MIRLALTTLLPGLVAVASVRAATLAGVELPETVTVDRATLELNGLGLRQATVLRVKAYVGGSTSGSAPTTPTRSSTRTR